MNPIDRAGSPARSVGGGIATSIMNNAKSYLGNLGRSAKDVPTALGTALDSKGAMATGSNGNNNPMAPIKNLATQVGQVAGAVVGKKDNSRSSQYYGPNKTYIDSKTDRGFYLNNPSKLGK
jgi:hypothetical protein